MHFETPPEDRRLGHEALVAKEVARLREAKAKRETRKKARRQRGRDLRKRPNPTRIEDRIRDGGDS